MTQLITDPTHEWHISYHPSNASSQPATTPQAASVEIGGHSPVYPSLSTQIYAVMEKRAMALGKLILNELEKRLLQRSQSQNFETFLIGVLLLSCSEDMCWFYGTYECGERNSLVSKLPSQASGHTPILTPSLPQWPFHDPPTHFTSQGETFSDLICELLRLRHVLPKTFSDPDGYLTAEASSEETVREWFEKMRLKSKNLFFFFFWWPFSRANAYSQEMICTRGGMQPLT
jgi:hypothetical protein